MWGHAAPTGQSLTNAARSPDFTELRCMNFTSKGTREILVAGCQDNMFKVDVDKGTIVDTVKLLFQCAAHPANARSSPPTPNTPS